MSPPKRPPTAAQRAVLARLAAGERLTYWGPFARTLAHWTFGGGRERGLALNAERLRDLGLIRKGGKENPWVDVYELTPEGRVALDADGPRGEAAAR